MILYKFSLLIFFLIKCNRTDLKTLFALAFTTMHFIFFKKELITIFVERPVLLRDNEQYTISRYYCCTVHALLI